MKVKEEKEKASLKLNIQKTKIMASGPITLWEIDGETVEAVSDFIFLGSKITVDGDCSHEIKMLASWKKRHYFTDKGQSSQSLVFPVVMYGCESMSAEELMFLNCGVGEDS